ncbi:MAG: 16S rRNA (guanine(527)-N(7))-methyltransferase RsmG [Epsilonproteobacteria bacterium]|nr:16S rRNA (guanine(527)-N(7))-methyltransferase RsmG [Campylobacterota bacterium]
MVKMSQKSPDLLWQEFADQEGLNPQQVEQFKQYESFLNLHNQQFNLTAITDLRSILRHHFSDSLVLRQCYELQAISSIADIGTGAGFPAIPLKIVFPHLKLVLIEVNHKKRQFLTDLANVLGLDDVQVCEYDWRTFLRITDYEIDLFVTRAALDPLELIRVFKPACVYNKAELVYWASKDFTPQTKVVPFIKREHVYKIGSRSRKLLFFGKP